VGGGSGELLGLEELPFADAERAADWEHLELIDALLKRAGHDAGAFPTTEESLKAVLGKSPFELSPYEQGGMRLSFGLKLVLNRGTAYSASAPEAPGIVYYAVNPTGGQFVLTISGLNAPVSNKPAMTKAEAFVGGKQPWGGLLAEEESKYPQ
jgi:hypothetical protein